MYECYLPLAEKLKIPVIGTSSLASIPAVDSAVVNPRHIAVDPFETALLGRQMTFLERLKNSYYYAIDFYVDKFVMKPKMNNFLAKYYQKIDTNEKKISLIFANSHPSLFPKPVVPSIVNVGGIHLGMTTTQPLPIVSD